LPETLIRPFPDLDTPSEGIEQPVLPDSAPLVGLQLDPLVKPAGAFGEDLDHQIRRPLEVLQPDDRGPFLGDEQQVGLDDVMDREEDIGRRDEESPKVVSLDEAAQPYRQLDEQILVRHERGRTHVVLSIDDLVTLAVLGKEDVILVGQFAGEIVESHGD
jgi:hypothetical protein